MKKIISIVILILLSTGLVACTDISDSENKQIDLQKNEVSNENLKMYFFDVGQADSIFIEYKNKTMLIDAGNKEDGKLIVDYLSKNGIKKIDLLCGTHPHEDHIGGLEDVINNFEVENIIMSKVSNNTSTLKNLLNAIKNKNLKVKSVKTGDMFEFDDLKIQVLSSETFDDNLNNSSIVFRIVDKNVSFLLMGDAESEVDNMILKSGNEIKSDVLKVGHHGSKSGTSLKFLSKVSPKYAVISVGKDNDYGHPSMEVVSNLLNIGSKVYRTDEDGTLLFETDGNNITVKEIELSLDGNRSESQNYTARSNKLDETNLQSNDMEDESKYVVINKKTKKYHNLTCKYVSDINEKNYGEVTLKDAKKEGYVPCSICNN